MSFFVSIALIIFGLVMIVSSRRPRPKLPPLTPFKRAVCMIGPCALAVLVLALWWK
jgi:hypothetical protein